MKELLMQLAQLGPGIAAGARGNGDGMAAFMEGYQRTMQQLDQQKRLQGQDAMQMEDRQRGLEDRERGITRQGEADKLALEDQEWQRIQRVMSLMSEFEKTSANAPDQITGEGMVESRYQALPPEMQATMAPSRDAAMRNIAPTVTGRQKKQVEAFVEAAVKTAFVADNPDPDPEIVKLPEHIAKILGKDTARLSELQQFAQLPVGKPQGKTRIPPAAGSMEEFSDPAITPERKAAILADRKAYMQSDDRAPRVTVNTGTNTARVDSRVDRLTASFNASPIVKEFNEVQAQSQTISQIVKGAWSGPGDMSIVFAFMKALDPNSVVRETEYANAAQSGNIFSGWAAKFNGALSPSGGFLSDQVKQDFLRTIEARMGVKKAQYENLRKQVVQKVDRIKAGAPETGDEAVTDYGAAFPPDAPQGFTVGQKVKNRKTGEMGEVTGVQPDGKPIIKPIAKPVPQ